MIFFFTFLLIYVIGYIIVVHQLVKSDIKHTTGFDDFMQLFGMSLLAGILWPLIAIGYGMWKAMK